jgi:hypothetical protein
MVTWIAPLLLYPEMSFTDKPGISMYFNNLIQKPHAVSQCFLEVELCHYPLLSCAVPVYPRLSQRIDST